MRLILSMFLTALTADLALAEEGYVVHATDVADRKAVIATVEPIHQLVARARIGGTIASLAVKEGDTVAAGADRPGGGREACPANAGAGRAHRLAAIPARSGEDRLRSRRRAGEAGVSTQTQLDQAKTNLDVAERNLAAMRFRDVVAQQASEGAVLSPGAGRVLTVPVSAGRVVLPGETIATLAEDQYILRLELPERHARFLRAGDAVRIGSRGLQDEGQANTREGRVRIVYPEIQGGRVIADVDVSGLGDYPSASAPASTSTREGVARSSFLRPSSTAAQA